jgi:hypothetical protein
LMMRRWLVADDAYRVGFGKPPKHTQFEKGRSGNPKGRPKRSNNITALILKTFNRRITASGPGGPRSMTKIEALILRIVNQAVNGDLKSAREALRLYKEAQTQEPFVLPPPEFTISFVRPDDHF